jgi:hypothetical protein
MALLHKFFWCELFHLHLALGPLKPGGPELTILYLIYSQFYPGA